MNNFDLLQKETQNIIDLIAQKAYKEANHVLLSTSELLDEMFDLSDDDADLVEITKYQVLLNQLHVKIKQNLQ
ncbi:hypothetical protein FLBR109950_08640 [Flavobacterium branchiophilum]|uniref:Uncharacterized protein n=2 Tax=Flavobacterium branchiophilum TaxID=55197 RepID=G2YZU4_FLABF|nr:hypothetical protein [Flavobacterium branchiophilum]PDS25041.1 hypothetical protein B0A77_06205 [Flavobacterium branchiophilum]CCB69197.1 Hypothetical protein FBFL15_1108 [Flavobacterium branchiophilum FL-15]